MRRTHAVSIRLLRGLAALALVCATIALTTMFLEDRMIYFPTRYPDGFWDTEALAQGRACSIEPCFFTAEDGIRLHAWWCRPDPSVAAREPTGEMVLLWFHGNAGNLSHRADMMLALASLPTEVVIVDYRGYGRSQGRPSEQGLYRDARAAWSFLTDARGVGPDRIVLLGKSLGGAVAVDLAARVEPAGLIVQSSFTSVHDMTRHHFPFIPAALIRTRMDSLAKIQSVRCSKLFVHGPQDEVVPYRLGRRLFDAASAPKLFVDVPGAGHNETYLVGGRAYLEEIRRFVAECSPADLRTRSD